MNTIPECPWHFGERYLVTDFVLPNCYAIADLNFLVGTTNDMTVKKTAIWNRDTFSYPLTNKGQPSADGQLKRYQKSWCKWEYARYVPYMWSLIPEIMATRKGICIDTANICTSVLIHFGIDAYTVLGELRRQADSSLIGYHAWTEAPYLNETWVIETTIDTASNNMASTKAAYDNCSDWAQTKGIYYIPQAKMNNQKYIEQGMLAATMPILMGLPATRVQVFGMARTCREQEAKPKQFSKEWSKQDAAKLRVLREAYR